MAKEPIEIWTIQMSNWRLAKERGIPMLDITAKSGLVAFAPMYSVVMDYKRGEVSEEDYTLIYNSRMNLSKRKFPQQWEKLKRLKKVALACYCKPGAFCHRHLFLDLVEEYLKLDGIEIKRMGEIEK